VKKSLGIASAVLLSLSLVVFPNTASNAKPILGVTVEPAGSIPPNYNAIATWDAKTQTACLYSAHEVKRANPGEPWATEGNCLAWKAPVNLKSGIYDLSWDNGKSHALLTTSVRAESRTSAVYAVIAPDLTWHAYSYAGGYCQYFNQDKILGFNLLRPIDLVDKASNAEPSGACPDNYPGINPLKWFRKTLHKNIDVISVSDLDSENYDLSRYKAIVLYGHNEYWTGKVREKIESAVSSGTGLLNISGNTGYRKLTRTGDRFLYDVSSTDGKVRTIFGEMPGETTTQALIPTESWSYPFYRCSRDSLVLGRANYDQLVANGFPSHVPFEKALEHLRGIEVMEPNDPIFAGTGLKLGSFFGYGRRPIMTVETDGVFLSASGAPDSAYVEKHAPVHFNIAGSSWYSRRNAPTGPMHNGRVGLLVSGTFGRGKTFMAGPIGWTNALLGDKTVQKITENALLEVSKR
jgi:hypothetical protein